jgi:hypothetical protein
MLRVVAVCAQNKFYPPVFLLAQKWFVMNSSLMAQINSAFRCGQGKTPSPLAGEGETFLRKQKYK